MASITPLSTDPRCSLSQHSTSVMNFYRPGEIVCLFPKYTFKGTQYHRLLKVLKLTHPSERSLPGEPLHPHRSAGRGASEVPPARVQSYRAKVYSRLEGCARRGACDGGRGHRAVDVEAQGLGSRGVSCSRESQRLGSWAYKRHVHVVGSLLDSPREKSEPQCAKLESGAVDRLLRKCG